MLVSMMLRRATSSLARVSGTPFSLTRYCSASFMWVSPGFTSTPSPGSSDSSWVTLFCRSRIFFMSSTTWPRMPR